MFDWNHIEELNNEWIPQGYKLVATEDGSPSLCWINSETTETMHHRGGAYAETQQIYGSAVRRAFAEVKDDEVAFLSLGLGMGYNEILVALESVRSQKTFKLISYEADTFLVERFLAWVNSVDANPVYPFVAQLFSSDAVEIEKVKIALRTALQNKQWIICGALVDQFQAPPFLVHCVLYDAFSSKTSPHLWIEEFLNRFLQSFAAADCIFSTYACIGTLKRALKSQNFKLTIRDGFFGKRNSTLGEKGCFVLAEL
jgi:tRNA U34 5-methylaminomethyl-2-thiouridine-forming methyltransferase MnmC